MAFLKNFVCFPRFSGFLLYILHIMWTILLGLDDPQTILLGLDDPQSGINQKYTGLHVVQWMDGIMIAISSKFLWK